MPYQSGAKNMTRSYLGESENIEMDAYNDLSSHPAVQVSSVQLRAEGAF